MPSIRCAHPREAAALTALAIRSKAHWGYDAAFMRQVESDLQVTADVIRGASAFVAETDGGIVGFYVLSVDDGAPTLRDLWIEPHAIGTGVGQLLWTHMLGEARRLGYEAVRIVSEPNAEGFYLKMGARRAGAVESPVVKGRMLPLLQITLT